MGGRVKLEKYERKELDTEKGGNGEYTEGKLLTRKIAEARRARNRGKVK
jgi:hypothetical protein